MIMGLSVNYTAAVKQMYENKPPQFHVSPTQWAWPQCQAKTLLVNMEHQQSAAAVLANFRTPKFRSPALLLQTVCRVLTPYISFGSHYIIRKFPQL